MLSKINVFGLAGMLACGSLLFLVNDNANASVQNERYGQDQNGEWHKMSELDPSEYSCEDTGICSAEYTADPSQSADPESLRVPGTTINGALFVQ